MRNTEILEEKTKWKTELFVSGGRELAEEAKRRRNKREIGEEGRIECRGKRQRRVRAQFDSKREERRTRRDWARR